MAPERRPLVVHADARPGSELRDERLALDPLGCEVIATTAEDEDGLIANLREADVVLVSAAQITRRVLESLPRCRAVVRYGIGVDNVDLPAATRAGILVTNVPDYCVDEVSDHALALLLALARQVVMADRAVRGGAWDVVAHSGIRRLRGQTVGLLGFGKIARAVAARATQQESLRPD